MSQRLIKDDLKHVIFSEIYFRIDEPKGRRKALALLEAAIKCYARKGFENATLEMIAREAGYTKTIFKYYFADAEDIRTHALKYIRSHYQKMTIDALSRETKPENVLLAYLTACLEWAEKYRTHAIVWHAFLQKCARDKKSRDFNTAAQNAGTARIAAMIKAGVANGDWQSSDLTKSARAIQYMIIGAIIVLLTENAESLEAATEILHRQVLGSLKNPV